MDPVYGADWAALSSNVHCFYSSVAHFGALCVYGSDSLAIQDLMRTTPSMAKPLHPDLPYTGAEVVWAPVTKWHARGRRVARRTRALFLNERAAEAMAPDVVRLMGDELGWDGSQRADQVTSFAALLKGYEI